LVIDDGPAIIKAIAQLVDMIDLKAAC